MRDLNFLLLQRPQCPQAGLSTATWFITACLPWPSSHSLPRWLSSACVLTVQECSPGGGCCLTLSFGHRCLHVDALPPWLLLLWSHWLCSCSDMIVAVHNGVMQRVWFSCRLTVPWDLQQREETVPCGRTSPRAHLVSAEQEPPSAPRSCCTSGTTRMCSSSR